MTKKTGDAVLTRKKQKVKKPRMYKVILHNDDFTTMEFVIRVLKRYFDKNTTEATKQMLEVHLKGHTVGGIFTKELAETKVQQVIDDARRESFPFLATMEPE